MDHPDPNADFVEQILAATRRLAEAGGAGAVTDVRIADATGLHLPTVRAVLAEEDGRAVAVERGSGRDPWRVTPL